MSFATEMREMADEMIREFGRSATLQRTTQTPDPATSSTVVTAANHAVQLVETDFKAAQIPDTLVQSGDRAFLVSAEGLAIEPQADDQLLDGTDELSIVYATRIKPGDTAILYGLLVRA